MSGSAQELLHQFLTTRDEAAAKRSLARLLDEHARPVIESVIRRKLEVCFGSPRRSSLWFWRGEGRGGKNPPRRSESVKELDAEDLYSTTVLCLMQDLQARREQGHAEPIRDFSAYVARIAINAFSAQMRRRYPERHLLRRRLVAMLSGKTAISGFAMWEGRSPHEQLCGFQAWKGRNLRPTRSYRRWQEDPHAFPKEALAGEDPSRLPLPELAARIFDWLETPISVDALVRGLVELLDLREPKAATALEEEDVMEQIADPVDVGDCAVRSLHHTQLIRALWTEVCALPLPQRRAVLLHLEREEVLAFVGQGCCTQRQLAETLAVSPAQFLEWLRVLPLPDERIGASLGLSGRDIINRRVSAQRRLGRRLKGWNES